MNILKKNKQNPITLKCDICDKEFKTNYGLKKHFNITHNLEKEYQCNICQKVFKIQSQLTVHMKVHETKKKQKCESCDSCGKAFYQSWILKRHIDSVHNGQKDHKCDSCGKEFS